MPTRLLRFCGKGDGTGVSWERRAPIVARQNNNCANLRSRASDFVRPAGFSRATDCADLVLWRRGEVVGLQLVPVAQ